MTLVLQLMAYEGSRELQSVHLLLTSVTRGMCLKDPVAECVRPMVSGRLPCPVVKVST